MSEIVYDRRGDGPPLVLIHGIGSRWQVWEPILDQLATRYDVISIDIPGFGASPVDPSVAIGARGYAQRIAAFISDLGLNSPAVAGNSMGGGIALELGRMGVASSVTAYSPIGFWSPIELRWCQVFFKVARASARRLRRFLPRIVTRAAGRIAVAQVLIGHPERLVPATLLDDLDGLLDCPGFNDALAAFSGYDVRDPSQDWGKLREVPTTIAWGSRDALLVYRTQSRRARAAMPWARHLTLRSCGHVPFYDDPVQCANVLLDHSGGTA